MSKKLEALASSMQVEFVHGRHFNNEYLYQHGHTGSERIYTTGRGYYAIQPKAPKFEANTPWVRHEDQFFAARLPGNLVVWFAE
jgi:hypothetical protein